MTDSKVFLNKGKGGLGQIAKSIISSVGLRGGQQVLFNMGKVTHPIESNATLLSKYSERCGKDVALGRAIPSYIQWLVEERYLRSEIEGDSSPILLPESVEEGFENGNQKTPQGAEDS